MECFGEGLRKVVGGTLSALGVCCATVWADDAVPPVQQGQVIVGSAQLAPGQAPIEGSVQAEAQAVPAPPAPPNVIRMQPLNRMPIAVPRPQMFQIKLSEYWLGLDCSPLHPGLHKHLKLEQPNALLVEQVVPESPAAKGGFAQHDILLAAGDKPIGTIEQLMQALDDAKGQPVEFFVLRAGEKQKVTATPEKRPNATEGAPGQPMWVEGEAPKVFSIVRDQLEKAGAPMRIQVFPLGAAPVAPVPAGEVPDNLEIHVDKQGKQPAKIVVERGEEKWTVEEGKLDSLPDDVRPHVAAMLDRLFVAEVPADVLFQANPVQIPVPMPNGDVQQRIERRMDDMNRRLEQLRQELNELRDKR